MGWDGFEAATPTAAINVLLADVNVLAGPEWRTQAGASRGRCWVLIEPNPRSEAAKLGNAGPVILHVLVDRESRNGRAWFYVKEISESMGPLDYDCPEDWLALAPMPGSGYASTWRAKVRRYWQEQRSE
jgi:hypothetical protein